MTRPSNSQYLESKVLTAPPHRLHLMLIEGAIRFGREAEAALRRGDAQAAAAPLLRVIDILSELLAGVRQSKTEVSQKIASLYVFLFRCVAEAKVNDDASKLTDALKLLDFERQTWQQLCDQVGSAPMQPASVAMSKQVIAPFLRGSALPASKGISFEA